MLVFKERGKLDYTAKNLSEQGREPTTNSTHIWRQRQDSNRGHIGGGRVLSPLCHPCSPDPMVCYGIFWSGQLMHHSLPEIRLHFSIVFSTSRAPFKGRWEMFARGIQNPGNFVMWNLELWALESRSPLYTGIGIWNLISTFWNPVHGIQNPRVVLDSLTKGNMGIHIHF